MTLNWQDYDKDPILKSVDQLDSLQPPDPQIMIADDQPISLVFNSNMNNINSLTFNILVHTISQQLNDDAKILIISDSNVKQCYSMQRCIQKNSKVDLKQQVKQITFLQVPNINQMPSAQQDKFIEEQTFQFIISIQCQFKKINDQCTITFKGCTNFATSADDASQQLSDNLRNECDNPESDQSELRMIKGSVVQTLPEFVKLFPITVAVIQQQSIPNKTIPQQPVVTVPINQKPIIFFDPANTKIDIQKSISIKTSSLIPYNFGTQEIIRLESKQDKRIGVLQKQNNDKIPAVNILIENDGKTQNKINLIELFNFDQIKTLKFKPSNVTNQDEIDYFIQNNNLDEFPQIKVQAEKVVANQLQSAEGAEHKEGVVVTIQFDKPDAIPIINFNNYKRAYESKTHTQTRQDFCAYVQKLSSIVLSLMHCNGIEVLQELNCVYWTGASGILDNLFGRDFTVLVNKINQVMKIEVQDLIQRINAKHEEMKEKQVSLNTTSIQMFRSSRQNFYCNQTLKQTDNHKNQQFQDMLKLNIKFDGSIFNKNEKLTDIEETYQTSYMNEDSKVKVGIQKINVDEDNVIGMANNNVMVDFKAMQK